MGGSLKVAQLELNELNAIVELWHRHHKRVQGHRFSIGCSVDGRIVGACSVGRPVARKINKKEVVEVTRLVTDGTPNVCSFLYSRAARIARDLGYRKIQTYILDSESGVSMKASGWVCEDDNCGGGQWKHTDGRPRRTDQPKCRKQRWVKYLRRRSKGGPGTRAAPDPPPPGRRNDQAERTKVTTKEPKGKQRTWWTTRT